MTIAERNNKLKHFITCLKCETSGKPCDVNCLTQYDAGNIGEIIENLEAISKALEQEPCEDSISREPFTDSTICEGFSCDECSFNRKDKGGCILEERVINLPSAKQEPNAGHWEWVQYDYNPKLGNWHCSECRCVVIECVDKEEKGGIPLYKYCPQCGAKMESEEP